MYRFSSWHFGWQYYVPNARKRASIFGLPSRNGIGWTFQPPPTGENFGRCITGSIAWKRERPLQLPPMESSLRQWSTHEACSHLTDPQPYLCCGHWQPSWGIAVLGTFIEVLEIISKISLILLRPKSAADRVAFTFCFFSMAYNCVLSWPWKWWCLVGICNGNGNQGTWFE